MRPLERNLTALGARLAWGDNPFIPYDDYLLSPAHSFVRLETPAGRMSAALNLLIAHLVDSPITFNGQTFLV